MKNIHAFCAFLFKRFVLFPKIISNFVPITIEFPLWTRTSIASKWCTNDCQPTMETYLRIAELLDVELTELVRTKKSQTNHASF